MNRPTVPIGTGTYCPGGATLSRVSDLPPRSATERFLTQMAVWGRRIDISFDFGDSRGGTRDSGWDGPQVMVVATVLAVAAIGWSVEYDPESVFVDL